jgi:ribosomal protein S14
VSLDRRLRRIEATARPSEPCAECGRRPGAAPRFALVGMRGRDESPGEVTRRCSGCGRVLAFTLDISAHSDARLPAVERGDLR